MQVYRVAQAAKEMKRDIRR